MPPAIRSIVLVCKMTYGDFLLALPFLSQLKRRHPEARVTMICGKRGGQICPLFPWIDEVVNLDTLRRRSTCFGTLGRLLRLFRADVIYALYPFFFGAVLAFLLAGRRRIGFAQASLQLFEEGRGFTTRHSATPLQEWLMRVFLLHRAHTMEIADLHATDRILQLLEPAPEPRPPLRGQLAGVYPRHTRSPPLVILAPFSGWTPRNWPLERWRQLALLLREELPSLELIVSVDPASSAEALGAFQKVAGARVFVPGANFDELFRTFSGAGLIVSNDSFPLHAGSALNVPTVGLFGPNLPKWFGGVAQTHADLFVPIECSPCVQRQHSQPCQRGFATCAALEALSVDLVAAKCLQILRAAEVASEESLG